MSRAVCRTRPFLGLLINGVNVRAVYVTRTDSRERVGGRVFVHDSGGARRQPTDGSDDPALSAPRVRSRLRRRHRGSHHQRLRYNQRHHLVAAVYQGPRSKGETWS